MWGVGERKEKRREVRSKRGGWLVISLKKGASFCAVYSCLWEGAIQPGVTFADTLLHLGKAWTGLAM